MCGVGSVEWGVWCGEWDVGSGEWDVGSGVWGVGSGVWGVGCGEWRVGCKEWGVGRGMRGVGRGMHVGVCTGECNKEESNTGIIYTSSIRQKTNFHYTARDNCIFLVWLCETRHFLNTNRSNLSEGQLLGSSISCAKCS